MSDIQPVALSANNAVGIDLGINHFAVISTGDVIENPAFLKTSLNKLALSQRAYARTKPGSNNRKKAVNRVGDCHRYIRNKRKDFLHKASSKIVKNHDVIVVENLNVKGMIRNRHLVRPS
jgi:putative transposase